MHSRGPTQPTNAPFTPHIHKIHALACPLPPNFTARAAAEHAPERPAVTRHRPIVCGLNHPTACYSLSKHPLHLPTYHRLNSTSPGHSYHTCLPSGALGGGRQSVALAAIRTLKTPGTVTPPLRLPHMLPTRLSFSLPPHAAPCAVWPQSLQPPASVSRSARPLLPFASACCSPQTAS